MCLLIVQQERGCIYVSPHSSRGGVFVCLPIVHEERGCVYVSPHSSTGEGVYLLCLPTGFAFNINFTTVCFT